MAAAAPGVAGGSEESATSGIPEALNLSRANVAELLARLRERSETIATAESLTGGLVTATLTDVAGASDVVRGGLVVYATDLKGELAGVDHDLLATHGAVHPLVAASLAAGARRRCAADWGVGLTGVAGPAAQDGVPPGTIHVGFDCAGVDSATGALPAGNTVRTVRLAGERTDVRAAAVRVVLEQLGGLLR